MLDVFLAALLSALAIVQTSAFFIYFLPERNPTSNFTPPLSIIIPAHNEAKNISATIKSILSNKYKNKKEIIVVDDGSTDETMDVVKKISAKSREVRAFSIPHSGKSKALNYGLKKSSYGIVAFLDADSALEKDSLEKLVQPLSDRGVAASSGVIRAKCTRNPLTWMQDIDYIISSGWRYITNKLDANYSMPGFAAFRKSALMRMGGFSRDTLTEDLDIGLSLRKSGFRTVMSRAVMCTTVPSTIGSLFHQRIRWGRGSIQVAKKHSDMLFTRRFEFIGLYAFPVHLFWYAFAIAYLPFLFYWFLGDYANYFLFSGAAVSMDAAIFFVKWLTIYGIADLIYGTMTTAYALNTLTAAVIAAWGFSFAYFILLLRRFSGAGLKTLVAYLFIFPYFWFILTVQGASLIYEALSRRKAANIWNKGSSG